MHILGYKAMVEEEEIVVAEVGPGSYKVEEEFKHQGGFISKEPRKIHELGESKPGPGAYSPRDSD